MVVAHINHGLRENAKIDEQYVFEFCNRINIRCFILHADIKKGAEIQKRGLEETGRIIRYKFFDEIQSKTNSNKIAIAHNSNDNVETIIMNIVRGSGLGGLKGIEAINGKYIRPLIETSRDDIESYCEEKKLNPRYDESNDDNVYTRNKIRNSNSTTAVIPITIIQLINSFFVNDWKKWYVSLIKSSTLSTNV